jgi:SulP family sulfate permease
LRNWDGLRGLIPLHGQLEGYSRGDLRSDLGAGVAVGVMLIPQGMAYALIAGMPPIYGLYSALVPLFVYALWGSSRKLAVGPVAMVSLLVAAGVRPLAEGDPTKYVELALLLSLMVGVLQLAMGLLRFGALTRVLSHPVLAGFTSAAALVIGTSQLHHLTGVSVPAGLAVHEILFTLASDLGAVHLPTFLLGVGGIFLLLGLQGGRSRVPGALVVVAVSIPLVALLGLQEAGVRVLGAIPSGLPAPLLPLGPMALEGQDLGVVVGNGGGLASSLPPLSVLMSHLQALLPVALTIALVGYMESIAVAKVYATRDRVSLDPNRELVALGLANFVGAFFRAFPTTGGFSRTAVNDQAGARTTVASLASAGVVALTLLFLTPLFTQLPNAILAAIVLVAVSKLVHPGEPARLWQTDRRDFLVFAATFASTLLIGIEEGIIVGILASLLTLLTQRGRARVTMMQSSDGMEDEATRTSRAGVPSGAPGLTVRTLRVDLEGSISFVNAEGIRGRIREQLHPELGVGHLVLGVRQVRRLDSTALHQLEELIADAHSVGIRSWIWGADASLGHRMLGSGFLKRAGAHGLQMVQDLSEVSETTGSKSRRGIATASTELPGARTSSSS